MRATLNPQSEILSNAVVGGAGLSVPADATTPDGMAAIVLYVPIDHILGKNPMELQRDMGLPWYAEGGPAIWFDEIGV